MSRAFAVTALLVVVGFAPTLAQTPVHGPGHVRPDSAKRHSHGPGHAGFDSVAHATMLFAFYVGLFVGVTAALYNRLMASKTA